MDTSGHGTQSWDGLAPAGITAIWKLIEDPKYIPCGIELLVSCPQPDGPVVYCAQFNGDSWYASCGGALVDRGETMVDLVLLRPTHWVPMPAGPTHREVRYA